MIPKTKKIGLSAILTSVIFTFVFGATLLAPEPAKAQYHDFPGWAGYFQPWTIKQEVKEKEKSLLEKIKTEGVLMVASALMNALNYFANKIAYDMAVYLAAGDFGQGPFASTESFGSYLAQTAGDALGEALATLSEDLGMDLCNLPDIRLDLMLKLGLHFNYGPPKPGCTWQQLKSAYNADNIRSKYASKEGLASRLGMGVQVEDSDFGVWFSAKEKIDTRAAETTAGAQLDRQEGQGVFAMSEIISRKQVTPATVMREEFTAQSAAAQRKGRETTALTGMSSALAKGGTSLALNTVSTFVNTLLGTVVDNFITKGMLPGGKKICNPGLSITGVGWDQCEDDSDSADSMAANYYSSGSAGTGDRRAAQEMFSEFLKPKIRTLDNYDITANMAECSEDNLAPEACVVDQSFLQILQQDSTGEPFTIKQALERGLLHGDWKIVPSCDSANNQKFDCSQSAYCHRNLRYLRLARVLPLGLEIVAQDDFCESGKMPPTLKEVVDGFYNPSSAYYKLVNPHWVIKLPKMRCKSYVYSAISADGVRLQTCADLQHCVSFNKDGSCASWGYCMREKPVWRFKANYCDSQYNTCKAFTNSSGDSVGYLTRTLDTEQCNAENDGCTHYINAKHYFTATSTDWYLPYSTTTVNGFINTNILFNKKASTCSASNDGCSAFKLASNPDTTVYLKKAPDYLFCYDADSVTMSNKYLQTIARLADGVSWPKTISDLSLLRPADADKCNDYAQVCLPEEENCNLYTSSLSGEVIPGKFKPAVVADGQVTWNDQCDAKCVGYAAYQEMPSNYSNGNPLAYIIPASGKTCAAADDGCSAFVNLSTDQGGLEQTEYFSYLRLCMLPDANKQKNFYVYESTEKSGYQLKTYTFEKNDVGGPKQIFQNPEEMSRSEDICSEEEYLAGTADPDCHRFTDDQGNEYYAMLSKTVIVSDDCKPYRLNSPELIEYTPADDTELRCPFDFAIATFGDRAGNAVEFKDNSCYYMGYLGSTNGAGDTQSCTKEANSCRAFKGNAGNNMRTIISDTFETASSAEKWSNVYVDSLAVNHRRFDMSNESTQVGGHSLKVSINTTASTDEYFGTEVDAKPGKSYSVIFWAKGNSKIRVLMGGEGLAEVVSLSGEIQLTDVWNRYEFGPAELPANWASDKIYLFLEAIPNNAEPIFIDNLKLSEVQDYLYLVKDSLSVDPICDSNLSDNLPGEALGCMAYSDPAKNTYNLINFNYLCREGAIGCTALLDTFNTPDDAFGKAYNVWLKGTSGSVAEVMIEGAKYSCQVPVGKTGCYTNISNIANLNNLYSKQPSTLLLTNSTIVIPPDTSTTTPIYLVASKTATCKAENMGCQVLGKGKFTPSGNTFTAGGVSATHYEVFEDVAIKNDPALYDTALCKAEEMGCKIWKSGESTYYFKDPVQNGNMVCKYVEPMNYTYSIPAVSIEGPYGPVEIPASSISFSTGGWVWKDVGICSGGGKFCTTDSDCNAGLTCNFKNLVPCAPTYKSATGGYGLWSSGSKGKYKGFVGECPVEQSGCTEFVDHSSADSEKKCSISGKKCETNGDCSEESEDDICVVNPENAYYLIDNQTLSDQKSVCNGQVSPAEGCVLLDNTTQPTKMYHTTSTYESSLSKGDIMINPLSAGEANDANTILKVIHDRICGEWAYCDLKQEYEDEETGEASSRCYHLGVCKKAGAVDAAAGTVIKDCTETVTDWDTKGIYLGKWTYQAAQNAWNSMDFSGYSAYNSYQVPDLTARKVSSTYRLVYVDSEYSFNGGGTASLKCKKPTTTDDHNDEPCGTETYARCWNGECLVAYDNSGAASSRKLQCRAYPDMMSPFPSTVVKDANADVWEFKEGFEGVNVCKTNNGNASGKCEDECGYRKIKTDGGEVYEPLSLPVEGRYICSTGRKAGDYCSGPDSTACGEDGTCSPIKSFQVMNGWMGYCLQRDASYRINGSNLQDCMMWWPVESPPGVPNSWEQDPRAGYEIAEGAQDRFICLENEPILKYDKNFSKPEDTSDPENDHHINWGGLMVGFEPYYAAYIDYSIQEMPKNNAYKMIPSDEIPGTEARLALTNLPNNVAVSGCYDPANGGTYTYGSVIKDSTAEFCPINRDTLLVDGDVGTSQVGDSMALCTGVQPTGLYYNNEKSRWECNEWNHWEQNTKTTPNAYYHWNQFSWANQYGAKFFNREEIERIDVFFDGTKDVIRGDGYVSFIRDAINDDEGEGDRSFIHQQSFNYSEGDSSIHSVSLDSVGLTGWYAWQYYGGIGTAGWTINDGTSDKMDIVKEGVKNDERVSLMLDSTSANTQNIGVRVVFDDENNLHGIWLNFEATDADGDYVGDSEGADGLDIGYFFVIHFTHGKCKKFAQVSDSTKTEIDFKPYPNYLNNDEVSVGLTGDYSRAPEKSIWDEHLYYTARKAELNGGKFGMAFSTEDGYVDIRTKKAVFINPFTYYDKMGGGGDDKINFYHSQSGDINANYEFLGYGAGIPLTSRDFRTGFTSDDDNIYFDYSGSIPYNTEYYKMLTKMFAKVGNIWALGFDGGYNNGYAIDGDPFDAANPSVADGVGISGISLFPPRVAAPSSDGPLIDAISVNGQTEGNIYLYSGAQTHIKFYAWAHGNQMPIRQIVVDKGDAIDTRIDSGMSASIGNRKPICSDKNCNDTNGGSQIACNDNDDCDYGTNNFGSCQATEHGYEKFGNTEETGCKAKPWDFVMDYNCPYGTMEIVETNDQPDDTGVGYIDWDYIRTNFYNAEYVCVARPRVHILDNWGWCTGSCSQSYAKVFGPGCYKDGATDKCDIDNGDDKPWINYDGWVVVVPLPS